MDDFAPIIWIALYGIPALVLWITMLIILSTKNDRVNYFVVNPYDYVIFYRVIKAEKNKLRKVIYLCIFLFQIFLLATFLIGGIIIARS
jgi:hypothetical protein